MLPTWFADQAGQLGGVVAKAVLMYLVALAGLRMSYRRTLSQWTAIDFAAAVAIGAILGRTAVAEGQSFLVGATALLTVLAAHTAASRARFHPLVAKATDHRIRVLVSRGSVRRRQLQRCGVTEADLFAQLRQHGVRSIEELRYVLYETKGALTVVRETGTAPGEDDRLVQAGLRAAVDFDPHP